MHESDLKALRADVEIAGPSAPEEKPKLENEISDTRSASSLEHGELKSSTILKAAQRKADRRIVLWYSFVYLIMRIHVSNVTNTAIINIEEGDGIKKQLGNLTSGQWAWVLSIFYYPYMFIEPVSTMMLKRFSPSVWMSRIMVTWGIISMCQGATHNYSGILAARFFLGEQCCLWWDCCLLERPPSCIRTNTSQVLLKLAFTQASSTIYLSGSQQTRLLCVSPSSTLAASFLVQLVVFLPSPFPT